MITRKDIRAMVENAGMSVVSIHITKHYRVKVQRLDGSTTTTTIPKTPGDKRSLLNLALTLPSANVIGSAQVAP